MLFHKNHFNLNQTHLCILTPPSNIINIYFSNIDPPFPHTSISSPPSSQKRMLSHAPPRPLSHPSELYSTSSQQNSFTALIPPSETSHPPSQSLPHSLYQTPPFADDTIPSKPTRPPSHLTSPREAPSMTHGKVFHKCTPHYPCTVLYFNKYFLYYDV